MVQIGLPSGESLESKAFNRSLAIAVGAHHGSYHSPISIREYRATYLRYHGGGWEAVQDQALEWLARTMAVKARDGSFAPPNLSARVLMLSGLTSVCDWIGSSGETSRCRDRIDPGATRSLRGEATRAVTRRGMLEPERLRTALGRRGGSSGRPSPACSQTSSRPAGPGGGHLAGRRAGSPALLVVEAPMGEGKTEAALWWAAACQSDILPRRLLGPAHPGDQQRHVRPAAQDATRRPDGVVPDIRLIHGASALQPRTDGGR